MKHKTRPRLSAREENEQLLAYVGYRDLKDYICRVNYYQVIPGSKIHGMKLMLKTIIV